MKIWKSKQRKILIFSLFLATCATAQTEKEEKIIHYDTSNPNERDDHFYIVKSDSEEPIEFDIRISNDANDINCKNGHIYSSDRASKSKDVERSFDFSRKGSPNIALYEWHMCFIVDGITYRAWRGFDPGPGSTLKVACSLDKEQLTGKNTGLYLCRATDVKYNENNYSEFATSCKDENSCRRF